MGWSSSLANNHVQDGISAMFEMQSSYSKAKGFSIHKIVQHSCHVFTIDVTSHVLFVPLEMKSFTKCSHARIGTQSECLMWTNESLPEDMTGLLHTLCRLLAWVLYFAIDMGGQLG